jgi:hypothetical protein
MIGVGELVPVPVLRRSLRYALVDGRLQFGLWFKPGEAVNTCFVGDGYRVELQAKTPSQRQYVAALECWLDEANSAAGSSGLCYIQRANWELSRQREKFLPGWCGRLDRRLTGWEANLVWRHWRRFLQRKYQRCVEASTSAVAL